MSKHKQTPLFPEYEKWGAKTIDFGGWDLPVHYAGVKHEHEVTRTKAGLFDVSHMGEIVVKGSKSTAFLQQMMTNDVAALTRKQVQYTFMCYEDGGTVDDLLIYKIGRASCREIVEICGGVGGVSKRMVGWREKR